MEIELRRLARAVHLDAAPLPDGMWLVVGGREPHIVSASSACDCFDFEHHGGLCKHALAVRLSQGDPATLHALRRLVPLPQRHRSSATATEA